MSGADGRLRRGLTEIEVPPAYRERPDPDEPWRYACPRCESVDVRTNLGGQVTGAVDPDETCYQLGSGFGRRQGSAPYYCDACDTGLTALHDRKTSQEVAP